MGRLVITSTKSSKLLQGPCHCGQAALIRRKERERCYLVIGKRRNDASLLRLPYPGCRIRANSFCLTVLVWKTAIPARDVAGQRNAPARNRRRKWAHEKEEGVCVQHGHCPAGGIAHCHVPGGCCRWRRAAVLDQIGAAMPRSGSRSRNSLFKTRVHQPGRLPVALNSLA